MAGGRGRRFWPMGTSELPKQFLPLAEGRSLLRETYERIAPLVGSANVLAVTVPEYEALVREHLPELGAENVVVEPVGKNTAPCVLYGSLLIRERSPDAVTAVLPADHAVSNPGGFRDAVAAAALFAHSPPSGVEGPLVTLGVAPRRPETEYGYVRIGRMLRRDGEHAFYSVERFDEKPDPSTARRYVERGDWLWNSGVFVWSVEAVIEQFRAVVPAWVGRGERLLRHGDGTVEEFYASMDAVSVDELILERTRRAVVLPLAVGWSDLGGWAALDAYLRSGGADNVSIGSELHAVDASGCLVVTTGGAPAVLVGVRDLVVVSTPRGVLVMDKVRGGELKGVVERMDARGVGDG